MSDSESDHQLEELLKVMSGKNENQAKKKVATAKKDYKRKMQVVHQKVLKAITSTRNLHVSHAKSAGEQLRAGLRKVRAMEASE